MTNEELEVEKYKIIEELKENIVVNKEWVYPEAKFYIPGKVLNKDVNLTINEAAKLLIRRLKQPEDFERGFLKEIKNQIMNLFGI